MTDTQKIVVAALACVGAHTVYTRVNQRIALKHAEYRRNRNR